MKPREYCIGYDSVGAPHFCPNKTSGFLKIGRRNPVWCEDCDAKRISRLDQQFKELAKPKEAQP